MENTQNGNGYISVKDIALRLGMDRSAARRYILKLGYEPMKRRTPDSGGQPTLVVTEIQSEEIIAKRLLEYGDFTDQSAGEVVITDHGFFYIIQLVPELDPRRVKLGFAVNVNDRLTQHRTSAPTASCLRSWPCKRTWEVTAMDCITHTTSRLIFSEVFECEDVEQLVQRAEQFFGLMPNPDSRLELAECSPLNNGQIAPQGGE